MTKEISLLLDEARSSISDFCINSCKAQCCKKGKLLLQNKGEIDLIAGKEADKMTHSKILQLQPSGNSYFDFEKNGPCKHLNKKTSMCGVYKHPNRPIICSDYPLFKMGDYIISAGNCPAVTSGEFEPYFKILKGKGYRII